MRSLVLPALLLSMLFSRADAEEEKQGLGARVNRALDWGAAWLVTRQEADGSWYKTDPVHPRARTALCTYALLHAGYPRTHPAVKKGLAFLELGNPQYHADGPKPRSTYEAGCLLLLLHALGPAYTRHIHEICDWLVPHFDQGPKLWGYPGGTPDLSNTQYAVFGLKVGEMHGYKVPDGIWKGLIRGVVALQSEDGSFRYRKSEMPRATMTHAAMLVLLLSTQSLKGRRHKEAEAAMARGHRYCNERYSVEYVPWGRGRHVSHYYYYMYGLERYAELFKRKEISGHDWYREGAEELLQRQNRNGSWGRLEETCFAILFLKKVTFTSPVARKIGKTEGGPAGPADPARPVEGLPYLDEWLVAGPFKGTVGDDGMLAAEHFKIKRMRPGDGAKAGSRRWAFKRCAAHELDQSAAGSEWSTSYAALYLHAEDAGTVTLWLATEDGFKLYLNGAEILDDHHHGYTGTRPTRITLHLKAGRNLLIVKLERARGGCRLQARLDTGTTAVRPSIRRK